MKLFYTMMVISLSSIFILNGCGGEVSNKKLEIANGEKLSDLPKGDIGITVAK